VGGQTRVGAPAVAAAAGGRAVGLSEWVFDGITSNIFASRLEKEKAIRKADARLTEVKSLPGSPNDDRQEISSLPRGMTAPGACWTGMAGGVISLRT
jgi:hypothetical protein